MRDVTRSREHGNTSARPSPWAAVAVALACLALGAMGAFEMHHVSMAHGHPEAWSRIFPAAMPRWALLAALLPLVLYIGVRPEPPRLPTRIVLAHLVLFLVISWLHAAVSAWAMGLSSPVAQFFPWWARLLRAWYAAMPTMVSLYGAVLLAAWGMAEARERQRRTLRAAQLETQLQAARLETLRAKLQPHFLYNTLNGIAALVAGVQPERAVRAIEQLSELLHASLRDDGREQIPLREEVALAERYLALQRMRFGSRLQYEIDLSPAVEDCIVPVLLLQPLIENAVVHGLEAGVERLHVTIRAEDAPNGVVVHVENDGPAFPANAKGGEERRAGVGLAATRARLTTAHGRSASLEMLPRAEGGVSVRIVLPRRLAAPTLPDHRRERDTADVT